MGRGVPEDWRAQAAPKELAQGEEPRIAGIVPWIVVMLHFVGAVNSGDAKPPSFVYAIVPTLFVFFNIFAINMVLQYKKVGRWNDYLFGERVYIILSLSAKTVLCWLIWTGTLAPV